MAACIDLKHLCFTRCPQPGHISKWDIRVINTCRAALRFVRSLLLCCHISLSQVAAMNSFLFPEDISSPVALGPNDRQRSALEIITARTPPMPSRMPPMAPQQDISRSSPPQPCRAPPPPPPVKDKPVVLVTELSIPDRQLDSNLQRTKSKRSFRQAIGFSQLKNRKDAKAVSQAERFAARSDVSLPPLSPVVDEEFWRTGRYPSSQQGFTMAHVPF
jgi:hypothetical protein